MPNPKKKSPSKKSPARKKAKSRALPWAKSFNEVIVREVIAPRLNNVIESSDEAITTMKQFRSAFETTYAAKVSPPTFREWCTTLGYSFKAALAARPQTPYENDGPTYKGNLLDSVFKNPLNVEKLAQRIEGYLKDVPPGMSQTFNKSELLTPSDPVEGDLLDDNDNQQGPLGGPPAPVRQPVENDPYGIDFRTAMASRSDTPGVILAPSAPGSY